MSRQIYDGLELFSSRIEKRWDEEKQFFFGKTSNFSESLVQTTEAFIESILFRYHKPIRKCVDLGMKTVEGKIENEIYNLMNFGIEKKKRKGKKTGKDFCARLKIWWKWKSFGRMRMGILKEFVKGWGFWLTDLLKLIFE